MILDWQDKQAMALGGQMMHHRVIEMGYVNHRGREGTVNISPDELFYGRTDWHPEPQWLLLARNIDRNVMRRYALQDVLWWRCRTPRCSIRCWLERAAGIVHEVRARPASALL